MNIKLYLIFLPALLIITGCSKEETESEWEQEIKGNTAPAVPEQFFPENNADCTSTNLELQWKQAVDPDGDDVKYRVELSKDPDFGQLVHLKFTSTLRESVSLERGVIYYWRVQARDYKSNTSEFSTVRTFNTEPDPEYNSFPFRPEQIKPGNRSSVEIPEVLLEWSAVDPDGDELRYDLYLSKEDPPQLLKADLQENSLEVKVEAGSTYYWKIVAKDPLGAKAVGEVWKFTVN